MIDVDLDTEEDVAVRLSVANVRKRAGGHAVQGPPWRLRGGTVLVDRVASATHFPSARWYGLVTIGL